MKQFDIALKQQYHVNAILISAYNRNRYYGNYVMLMKVSPLAFSAIVKVAIYGAASGRKM